ncbi:MAG: hypothetical protein KatS3mg119_1059 [Rhodothalassiaceae bacterium]|nr:MAG: hypothetical protein KatS3mg119_1059 [Rhodothalassiaceae bacterium]
MTAAAGIRRTGALLALGALAALGALMMEVPAAGLGDAARGLRAAADALAADLARRHGLVVKDITLTGAAGPARAAIMADLQGWRGRPLIAVDPDVVLAGLLADPWVRRASVERRWPDRLVVTVATRTPAAVLLADDGAWLVADDGTRLARAHDAGRDAGLLRVAGAGAARALAGLMELAAGHPAVFSRLDHAVRVGDRRWDLVLRDGPRIMLPEDGPGYGPAAALARLAALEREGGILERALARIDLRLADRVFVAPLATAGARESGR